MGDMGILGIVLAILFGVVSLVRNKQVYSLRMSLLDEEYEWILLHLDVITSKALSEGFRRYNSLPSYDKMFLQFWKPVEQFREEIKSVEIYWSEILL